MQDNDPKHTSRVAKAFLNDNGINWWPTPPESPDMNPIENVWHELKDYIRSNVKPHTKQQLIDGIEEFFTRLDTAKCCRYINHMHRVIPKVVELSGDATGY